MIVLIGFKHTGKSVIGKSLAKNLQRPFIDLDLKIESLYEAKFEKKYTCRQILQEQGADFFRLLEQAALAQVMDDEPPSIVSLGGGAPLSVANQNRIQGCIRIHITAPQAVVFQRISLGGQPAFFNPEEDPLTSFNRLWRERIKIYQAIQTFSIENNRSVEDAVQAIMNKLGEWA